MDNITQQKEMGKRKKWNEISNKDPPKKSKNLRTQKKILNEWRVELTTLFHVDSNKTTKSANKI